MVRLISGIVEILLLAWLVKSIYNLIRALVLRSAFLKQLKKSCSVLGYHITRSNCFFSSFFGWLRKAPDLVIENSERRYLIVFITCQARKRFYYFINDRYYIRSMKLYTWLPMAKKVTASSIFKTIKPVPQMDEAFLGGDDKNEHQILLFNPSPVQISHLDENGTRKMIDGNGSFIYKWTIYDATTFLNYLNRRES